MQDFNFFGFSFAPWILIPVVFVIWIIVFFFIKKVVFFTLSKFSKRTTVLSDDILVKAGNFPVSLLIISGGFAFSEKLASMVFDIKISYFLIIFKVTAIAAVILFIDKFLNSLIQQYSGKIDFLKTTGGFTKAIVKFVIYGIGLLILLDSFGVSITPLLASLGIGSLAVALALQPTLENLFSGVQMIIDKPIQTGHFIKLETGEEGYVYKIGWRSTWIKLLSNNIVVIPNKAIVNSRIINYHYPEEEMSMTIEVGVHYNSDLEKVERITKEVAAQVLKEVKGAVVDFEPLVRFHTLANFSVNFTVVLRVKEFVDNYLVKHFFIKKLHERYAKEGIVIPYPITAVNYQQEKEQ